ncbi:hypothetical protein [Streptomyces sp. NPDC059009]|uniref:hypothetical protein n=1 Tax=Streptomyces sp. NPDC059009 TaxID=3346694 RepID=UPI003686BBBD
MTHKRAWGAATGTAAAATLVLTLSGFMPTASSGLNGDLNSKDDTADLSAQEIFDKSRTATEGATSLRIKVDAGGTGGDRTSESASAMPSVDLALDRKGDCTGTITEDGAAIELIKKGAKVWIKPDAAFWQRELPGKDGEAAQELLKNRYLYGTTADPMLKDVADACDLGKFLQDDDEDKPTNLQKGGTSSVDGTKVVKLTGKEDGKPVTYYVAAEGKPYMIKAEGEDDGQKLSAMFSDYDKPVPSKTPSADETVDVSKLNSELQST